MGVWWLRTRSGTSVSATTRNIRMGAHVDSARDGDRTGAGSESVRRRQLHCPDGQLARRALALRRVSALQSPFIGDHSVSSFAAGRAFPQRIFMALWTSRSGPRVADGPTRKKTVGLLPIASSS